MKRQAIVALLAMLLLLSVGCTQAMLAASATDREEHSLPFGPGGTVSLENVNGDLTVRVVDGQQVHILAEKRAKALDEAKAKEALDKLKIVIGSSIQRDQDRERLPVHPRQPPQRRRLPLRELRPGGSQGDEAEARCGERLHGHRRSRAPR